MNRALCLLCIINIFVSACTLSAPSSSEIETAIAKTQTSQSQQNQEAILNTNIESSSTKENCFPPSIPGVNYSEVKNFYESIGYLCDSPIEIEDHYLTSCAARTKDGNADITVEIYSTNNHDDIYLILSHVDQLYSNPSDILSSSIFCTIGALPYDNAKPDESCKWIKENISYYSVNSKVSDQPIEFFGGVRYHLPSAIKASRFLAIGYSRYDFPCENSEYLNQSPIVPTPEYDMPAIKPTRESIRTSTDIPNVTGTEQSPFSRHLGKDTNFQSDKGICLSGNGHSIVDIDKWDGPALIHIFGYPQDSFFMARGILFYVTNNFDYKLYDGVNLLDYFPGVNTEKLEIYAEGDWTIEIIPIDPELLGKRLLSDSDYYEGEGDDVVFLKEGSLYQVKIIGNDAKSRFIVIAYGEYGDLDHEAIIVNTTQPYEATIDMPEWVRVIEIGAEDFWSVEVRER